jgi:hypothetical protein
MEMEIDHGEEKKDCRNEGLFVAIIQAPKEL